MSSTSPATRDLLIGVDVGTTGTKTLLVGIDGEIVAEAYAGYPLARPAPLHVEQDAEDWWRAVVETVRGCLTGVDARRVAGMAVSAQGGAVVPVDGRGTPLARARSWLDRRAEGEERLLEERFGRRGMYERTGWRLYSAYTAVQLLNMRRTDPALFGAAGNFLSTADFVNLRLTGRLVSDSNSAGITQLMDVRSQQWDAAILREIGVTADRLSRLVPPGEAIGSLSPVAAAQLGLPEDVIVAAGGHDQYCAALGAGVLDDGDVLASLGTAWVVLGIGDALAADPLENFGVGRHVLPGRFGAFGSFRNGGVCLDWARDVVGGRAGPLPYALVEEAVASAPRGADGVTFLPYFDGSNIPAWSARSAGTFLGLELRHSAPQLLRAVMEGVCYELRGVLDAYRALQPAIRRVRVLGGASKSPTWMHILADVLDMPLEIPEVPHSACMGAAILGGVGAGVYPAAAAGYAAMGISVRTQHQDPLAAADYQRLRLRHAVYAERIRDMYEEADRP